MKQVLMFMAAVLSFAAFSLSAQIQPQIEYHYYPVTVHSQEATGLATDAAKPAGLNSSSKPSGTDWRIDYTFSSVRKYGNNCQVSTYEIKAICSITLPDYKSNDPLLAYRLKSYAERLKAHELGHCEIVKEHADKFEDWLDSIRYYNCGEVMNSVRRQYEIFMKECASANIKYDQATEYGKREGADLDLFLPRLENGSELELDRNPDEIKENSLVESDGDKEPGKVEETTPRTPPEPMSNYYQDKDGTWRNDARQP